MSQLEPDCTDWGPISIEEMNATVDRAYAEIANALARGTSGPVPLEYILLRWHAVEVARLKFTAGVCS